MSGTGAGRPDWWPWSEFDPEIRILPWEAVLVRDPSGVECRMDHAAITTTSLIMEVEVFDGSTETGPPPAPRLEGDFRMFITLPDGTELESLGEWESWHDGRREALHHPDWELCDYGLGDPRTGGGTLVLRPPPARGPVTFAISWLDHGVPRTEVTFEL